MSDPKEILDASQFVPVFDRDDELAGGGDGSRPILKFARIEADGSLSKEHYFIKSAHSNEQTWNEHISSRAYAMTGMVAPETNLAIGFGHYDVIATLAQHEKRPQKEIIAKYQLTEADRYPFKQAVLDRKDYDPHSDRPAFFLVSKAIGGFRELGGLMDDVSPPVSPTLKDLQHRPVMTVLPSPNSITRTMEEVTPITSSSPTSSVFDEENNRRSHSVPTITLLSYPEPKTFPSEQVKLAAIRAKKLEDAKPENIRARFEKLPEDIQALIIEKNVIDDVFRNWDKYNVPLKNGGIAQSTDPLDPRGIRASVCDNGNTFYFGFRGTKKSVSHFDANEDPARHDDPAVLPEMKIQGWAAQYGKASENSGNGDFMLLGSAPRSLPYHHIVKPADRMMVDTLSDKSEDLHIGTLRGLYRISLLSDEMIEKWATDHFHLESPDGKSTPLIHRQTKKEIFINRRPKEPVFTVGGPMEEQIATLCSVITSMSQRKDLKTEYEHVTNAINKLTKATLELKDYTSQSPKLQQAIKAACGSVGELLAKTGQNYTLKLYQSRQLTEAQKMQHDHENSYTADSMIASVKADRDFIRAKFKRQLSRFKIKPDAIRIQMQVNQAAREAGVKMKAQYSHSM